MDRDLQLAKAQLTPINKQVWHYVQKVPIPMIWYFLTTFQGTPNSLGGISHLNF